MLVGTEWDEYGRTLFQFDESHVNGNIVKAKLARSFPFSLLAVVAAAAAIYFDRVR